MADTRLIWIWLGFLVRMLDVEIWLKLAKHRRL